MHRPARAPRIRATSLRPWRARPRIAALVVLAAGALLMSGPSASAAAVRDLLPDLAMQAPDHLTVCGAPTSGTFQTENCPAPSASDKWLRFDSVILNVGNGTFRVRAFRSDTGHDHMHAFQLIRRSDGTFRRIGTDATLAWGETEDGHPHWHTQSMERYRLFRLPEPFPDGAKVGVKHGYCFFDGLFLRPDLRRAKPLPRYGFYSCGVPGQSQDATHLTVGLSIGWGDMYPWNYAGQRIDVSSVPDGDYLLCLSADPLRQFTERREGNNEGWAKLRLTSHPDPTFHVSVDILARGTTPCAKQVPYPIPDPSIAARHA